jgi:hypothetical protein
MPYAEFDFILPVRDYEFGYWLMYKCLIITTSQFILFLAISFTGKKAKESARIGHKKGLLVR